MGGTLSFSTKADASSPVGTYIVTPSGLTSSNYTLSFATGRLTVTPASLTLTADGKSQPQGAGNVNLTATPSGFVNGDTASVISGSANCATTATTSSPVGVYPITCTVGTLSAANYTFGPWCPAP